MSADIKILHICTTTLYFQKYTVLHCTALYCTVLHCTVLHCTALYCTVLHCTVLYCTAAMTRPLNTTAEVVADFDGDSHLATLVEGVIIPAIATLGLIGNTLAIKVKSSL